MQPYYGDKKMYVSTFLDPYWDNNQEGRYWKEDYYENNDDDCQNSDVKLKNPYGCQVTDYGIDD